MGWAIVYRGFVVGYCYNNRQGQNQQVLRRRVLDMPTLHFPSMPLHCLSSSKLFKITKYVSLSGHHAVAPMSGHWRQRAVTNGLPRAPTAKNGNGANENALHIGANKIFTKPAYSYPIELQL